jgi:hypothetical protein
MSKTVPCQILATDWQIWLNPCLLYKVDIFYLRFQANKGLNFITIHPHFNSPTGRLIDYHRVNPMLGIAHRENCAKNSCSGAPESPVCTANFLCFSMLVSLSEAGSKAVFKTPPECELFTVDLRFFFDNFWNVVEAKSLLTRLFSRTAS